MGNCRETRATPFSKLVSSLFCPLPPLALTAGAFAFALRQPEPEFDKKEEGNRPTLFPLPPHGSFIQFTHLPRFPLKPRKDDRIHRYKLDKRQCLHYILSGPEPNSLFPYLLLYSSIFTQNKVLSGLAMCFFIYIDQCLNKILGS